MARTGENIYKRSDGRWEGRYIQNYRPDGTAHYGYVYAKNYRDVKEKLRSASIENKCDTASSASFSQLALAWLSSVKLNCKLSTYNKYRNLYEKHILPHFGKYSVSKISPSTVEKVMATKLSSGKLSEKTVKDICSVLKQIFAYAEKNGHYIDCSFNMPKSSQYKSETPVLSKKEQDIFVSFLLANMNLYKLGMIISLYTGIRIGELCALKWTDISLENRVIHINKTMQRLQLLDSSDKKTTIVITKPKSKCSVRDIPIPPCLYELLANYKACDDFYILSGSKAYVEPRVMQYHFKNYVKEAGIEHLNFHALRHTFATRCIEIGFDVKTLSEILGHSSVNITLNRYVHSSMEQKQINMNKFTEF